MSEALFGFLGVIVGAVVSLLGEQFITRREREARRALQEQEHKLRRDTFQRETLLEPQDVIEDVSQMVFREYERCIGTWRREGRWQPRIVGEPLPKEWTDTDARITKLWARVFNAELQSMVADFQMAAGMAVATLTREQAYDELNHVRRRAHEVNSHIGVQLDELF